MTTKRSSKKKKSKTRSSKGSQVPQPVVHDEAERAIAEAAIRMFREARTRLHAARDPKSSAEAFDAINAAGDAVTRKAIELAEDEEEEEPDVVVIDGVKWRRVLTAAETYRALCGEFRVRRKLFRSERNGPTRCFYEERRGVMPGRFMPDLGRLIIETDAELPTERARAIIERATGQRLSSATMKRTTTIVGNALRDEERQFFRARISRRAPPLNARTVVVSVDALSFNLRGEGYKQATTATISFLDDVGDRVETIKLGEMPEEGKSTIMERVGREVGAIVKMRPELKTEVVIDGAPDLRAHMLRLFPDAVHVTDFFHVVDHIADALRFLHPGDGKLRDEQRGRLCHILKHEADGAATVMSWIRDSIWIHGARLREDDKAVIEGHASYIEGQLPFLNYAAAANDNMDLGSGAVEAACKTLVTQRLKISGAKWSRNGARAILYLRSLAQSGRLDDAISFHYARKLKRAA